MRVRLEKLVRQLAAQGGVAIISFGMAAGLAPQCSAGACLIGREVVYGGLLLSRRSGLDRKHQENNRQSRSR